MTCAAGSGACVTRQGRVTEHVARAATAAITKADGAVSALGGLSASSAWAFGSAASDAGACKLTILFRLSWAAPFARIAGAGRRKAVAGLEAEADVEAGTVGEGEAVTFFVGFGAAFGGGDGGAVGSDADADTD